MATSSRFGGQGKICTMKFDTIYGERFDTVLGRKWGFSRRQILHILSSWTCASHQLPKFKRKNGGVMPPIQLFIEAVVFPPHPVHVTFSSACTAQRWCRIYFIRYVGFNTIVISPRIRARWMHPCITPLPR